MKKLFGEIDLTWKKIILFAIVAGVYTALMALIPITKDTSFRDISIQLEWWILFGILIICNSKSPLDSSLKCFVFFLISQPLVYLLQVPFSYMGWKLFGYYRYWFIWTLLTIPMGFIGYYIKKKNVISLIILLPILFLLVFLGLGYFTSVIENFPHHLLSCIFCFATIIMVVINIFDDLKMKIFAFIVIVLFLVVYLFFKGGIYSQYENILGLNKYDFNGNIMITEFSGTKGGKAEIVSSTDPYSIKVGVRRGSKNKFTITDESNREYYFECYYDETEKTIVLKRVQ